MVISAPSAWTASIRHDRDGLAVEQDRAGAADAVLAADVGAGQAEVLAQEVRERACAARTGPRAASPFTVSRMGVGSLTLPPHARGGAAERAAGEHAGRCRR